MEAFTEYIIMTNLERFGRNLFHFFIMFAIIFLFMAAADIGLRKMFYPTLPKIDCADYPPVDGAGKPQVCK